MTKDPRISLVRRLTRLLALAPAVLVPAVAMPAFADAPTTWPTTDSVSPFHFLLVIVGIPLGLAVIITLLVYVPSLVRGEKYQPGQAWRNENEWFGGPREGVEAADKVEASALEGESSERGGASARW